MPRTKQNRLHHHSSRRRVILLIAAIVVIAAAGLYHYESTKPRGKVVFVNTETRQQTSNKAKSDASTGTTNSSDDATTGTTDKASSNQDTATTGAAPAAPLGDFVSSHTVSISANTAEESTCEVQSGVSCNITFTNGSTSKSLGSQTAGANGYVIWDWTPQNLPLTAGSWQITAVASLGSQTTSATDAKALQVNP